ncbi:MAG: MaoC family dehydratase N-terminal domain-containing protein [Candidatus Binataceae bacterium]
MKTFADAHIGDTLGPVQQFVSKEQCRRYARACGLDAPRFTDDEGARKEGLPGMILPGNMSLGIMSKLVTDWIGVDGGAKLIRLSTTYRVPVQPDHTFTLQGFITHATEAERTAEIDVWIENEDAERLVTGTATVQFEK